MLYYQRTILVDFTDHLFQFFSVDFFTQISHDLLEFVDCDGSAVIDVKDAERIFELCQNKEEKIIMWLRLLGRNVLYD